MKLIINSRFADTLSREQIEQYLEVEACFRDYTFRNASEFTDASEEGIHVLRPTLATIQDAVSNFNQYGGRTVYLYID